MKKKHWAFSGLDGAGKTTQIELFLKCFNSMKKPVRRIWLRIGYTPLLDWLRARVRQFRPAMLPPPGQSAERKEKFKSTRLRKVWLVLAMFDLFFYLAVYVRILKLLGYNIVSDRWLDDSNLDLDINFPCECPSNWLLWRVIKRLCPKPAKHFVFIIPVEESMRRSKQKKEPFPDSEAVLIRRLEDYEKMAKDKNKIKIDGTESLDAIQKKIYQYVDIL
ncbi:MAG: hypothetical protein P1U63_02775 [Coxiellaceae bacterium]|nr:hypothetical protein [Coxiellaceae bacterium]